MAQAGCAEVSHAGIAAKGSHRATPLRKYFVDIKSAENRSGWPAQLSLELEQEKKHVLWKQGWGNEKE